ncbi:hypothetical protein TSOC_005080 [Tetrabaena socialis]|uniref:Myb-like domain-containing protein n=1 Tax=Tetrabaena socialis TaxID=47790 RepID=A0A2J8A741_9CHLO|nr:hypothetical protein TSOC_005080 [Tetrabaena socialis]|eukprot:PNH08341.1 hypothetical protein TSOC_005080 [Tetrabaena socialis]
MRLPRTCTVIFAKRDICRHVGKRLYPSFLRLSWPETGEVLADKEEQTLMSYGVGHNDTLRLDLVVGDVLEALETWTQPRGPSLNHQAAGLEQAEAPPYAPAAGAAPARPTAAAAQAPAAPAAAAAASPLAAAQPGAIALVSHAALLPEQQPPQPQPRAGAGPGFNRCAKQHWFRPETMALLNGLIKYRSTTYQWILTDPEFAPYLEGRTGVNMKDRWLTLVKMAQTDFKVTRGWASKDSELKAKIREAIEVVEPLRAPRSAGGPGQRAGDEAS